MSNRAHSRLQHWQSFVYIQAYNSREKNNQKYAARRMNFRVKKPTRSLRKKFVIMDAECGFCSFFEAQFLREYHGELTEKVTTNIFALNETRARRRAE